MTERPAAQVPTTVHVVTRDGSKRRWDSLTTEEPMEIRLSAGRQEQTVAITMRTPGNDFELAAGFLYGEGILDAKDDLVSIRYCVEVGAEQLYNVVTVDLAGAMPDVAGLDRHFYTTSACGICGKASLDQIAETGGPPLGDGPTVSSEVVLALPAAVREAQRIFERTGGLHAAALFDPAGELLAVREDVGRHNAMDKLVGWGMLEEQLPFTDSIVFVSGRGSFELVQKSLRAGAAFFCAVSAPSSLAVEVAKRFGMTLIGFLRDDSFNVYTGEERIA